MEGTQTLGGPSQTRDPGIAMDLLQEVPVTGEVHRPIENSETEQQLLLLPYPSYSLHSSTSSGMNNDQRHEDLFDLISQTAKDVMSTLQRSPGLGCNQNTKSKDDDSSKDGPSGSDLPDENTNSETDAQRTIKYTDPHTMEVSALNGENNPTAKSANPFQIDQSQISAVPVHQQSEELQNLGLQVYNQDELEMGIMAQVDQALAKEQAERLRKIAEKDLKSVKDELRIVKQEMMSIVKVEKALSQAALKSKEVSHKTEAIQKQKDLKIKQLKKLKARLNVLNSTLNPGAGSHNDGEAGNEVPIEEALGLGPPLAETETERMIRQGEMTPFGTVMSFPKGKTKQSKAKASRTSSGPRLSSSGQMTDFEKYLADQQQKKIVMKRKKKTETSSHSKKEKDVSESSKSPGKKTSLTKSKSAPAFVSLEDDNAAPVHKVTKTNMFDKRDKRVYRPAEKDFSNYRSSRPRFSRLRHNFSGDGRLSDHEDYEDDNYGDADFVPHPDMLLNDDEDYLSGEPEARETKPRQTHKKSRSKRASPPDLSDDEIGSSEIPRKRTKKSDAEYSEGLPSRRSKDDGDYECYRRRIKAWKRERLLRKQAKAESGELDSDDSDFDDVEVDEGFKLSAKVWNKLYKYQKTCVKWLWELHVQQSGGIIGDEMGLGKTIQLISFLVGLKTSNARDRGANTKYLGLGPTLIACPATVMHQWVKEFHKWWPPFRVAVLHGSGSSTCSPAQLIDDIASGHGILVTSFSSLTIHQDLLLDYDWHYVVLDEGHKIRNPDAQITIAAKRFRTCHRLILSGSPIQNNLKELWSLFDFIFPGKLGTLPDFMEHFAVPIQQGGYTTASQVQVQTAYKCACVLRDTINPYLLRRMKSDVRHNLSLPDKNEQVLFCRLTEHQRDVYREYIDSRECLQIIKGEFMVFPGLITLRKICNHPDLTTGGPQEFETSREFNDDERAFGHYMRSGKMIVIESLLKLWKRQGHRVLLFSQSRQMLDVLESFVNTEGYTYIRMDGGTSISARQPLITKFNEDPSFFTFLLTTKVGGLGVNLTGANRVVIFDPDWNPSTDTQARERAWRIGQLKDVTVYRLITAGTIEEKIYHRQIFKQFLTNRVLKDPKQRRLFKSNDLYELFTLNDVDSRSTTETSALFAGTGSDVKISREKIRKLKEKEKLAEKKPNRFDIIRARKEKEKAEAEMGDELVINSESAKIVKKRRKTTIEKASRVADGQKQRSTSPEIQEKEEHGELPQGNMIDLTLDDDEDEESNGVNRSETNVSNAEVSNEDSRTKRLKELARKLSQKFSTLGAGDRNQGVQHHDKSKDVKSSENGLFKSKRNVENKDSSHNSGEGLPNGTISADHDKTRDMEKKGKEGKKDKRHRKNKRKRRKDAVIEGERIAYLSKFENYNHVDEDAEKEKMSKEDEDEYVLAKLFKKTGVHSAMQHDKIMMSSDPDFALVENEAERVAQDAARALKQSRSQCNTARSGIPTWTGQSGTKATKPRFGLKKNRKLLPAATASNPSSAWREENIEKPDSNSTKSKLFDGSLAGNVNTTSSESATLLSSADLLARMRARNRVVTTSNHGDSQDTPNILPETNVDSNDIELITDIRNYVAFMAHVDGQASTQEIVDYFKSKIPSGNSAKFKAMLQQICDFHKREGVGMWCLKPEMR